MSHHPATLRSTLHPDFVTTLAATGYAYPSDLVTNEEYLARARFPIEDAAALAAETRLQTRTWCAPGETTYTLARDAVARALASNPALRDEIDLVIVASGTSVPVLHPVDPQSPGTADIAPLLVRDLGRPGVLGFDLKACYCTGFLRAMQVADAMLADRGCRAALVVATEQGSRLAVAESNRSTFCFLMSDAAGAAVLRKAPRASGLGLIDQVGHTDGSRHDLITVAPDGISMLVRGQKAGAATLEMLVAAGRTLLDRHRLTPRDVSWLVPIQTHARVVDGLASALDWPRDRVLWRGDVTGFSGSASVPAALAEHIERGVIRKGDLVMSLAVGAGMNAAGALYYV
ncbi:MAG: hypothetical protein EOO75_02055 [Myxococcales bacterium]|nr:MAG: hypothetical protein EOO75_02055 [Myxococcales bacterium]